MDLLLFNIIKRFKKGTFSHDKILKVHLISMKRCSSLDPQLFNIHKKVEKKGSKLGPSAM